MPTSNDHFSHGYEGAPKRRGRGRVSPTGPYPAESSNKSVREKASPAERRKFSHGSSPTATRARKLERKDRRAAAKSAAAAKSPASRPVETLRRAEARIARTQDRKHKAELRESARRLRHALAAEANFKANRRTPEGTAIKANRPEPTLKPVAPRAYEKALKAAAAGGHGSSRGLGEPEDLTTAITLVAPEARGASLLGKAAAEAGGKQVAKDLAEAAASKIEAKGSKVISKAVNAGSAVRAGGRLAGRAALRTAGKDTSKLAERAAEAAAKRAARRDAAAAAAGRSKTASAAIPGIKAGKVGLAGTPAVRGHIEAVVDNPKAVAKRTAVGAEGLAIGAVKAPIDVGASAGRAASTAGHALGVPGLKGYTSKEITAPVTGLAKEQLDFAHKVAQVLTATDSKEVKKAVEDELGLLLPALAALGAKAGGEKLTKGRIVEHVRKIVNKVRKEPLDNFRGKTPRVFEKQGQHKVESVRIANAKARAKRDEQAATGGYVHQARSAHGGEVVRPDVRSKRGRGARAFRRGLAKEEAKGSLVVRPADVIPFATRHAIDLTSPDRALAQVKQVRAALRALPDGVVLPKSKLHTRDLLDYIERNAHVLADPRVRKALEERRKSGAYRREHAQELAPEHSERARYVSVATVKRRPLPENMFPRDVRDIVRAKPEHGVLAKDVLRKEAREDKNLAAALRRKAGTAKHRANVLRGELATREKLNKTRLGLKPTKSQLREREAVKAMERHGIIPRDRMPVGGHLRLVTDAKGKKPSAAAAPPALHDRIAERIDKLDVEAANLRELAARTAEMSKRKHKAAQGFDPALEKEFVDREAAALKAEGRPQPEYVHTGRAREAPAYGTTGAKLSQFPGKSKFRKGSAEAHGMVEEGLVPDIRESFRRPTIRRESYRALRGMLDANEFRVSGKKEWTSNEIRELFDEKVLNRKQWVAVPRQLYKRAYGKFDPEVAAAEMKLALEDKSPGTHFKLVRKAAADEFFSQLTDSLLSPKLVAVNRATNFLILATSPAWAAAQVAAEYVQGSIAQPKLLNPKWVKRANRAYEEMPPHKRQAFDSWVGVTTRELNKKEEVGFGTVEDAADAYSALHATPLGRILTSIHDFDQWKGGRIRSLVAIAKADKELNGRLHGFVRNLGRLDAEMGRQLKAMKGKPLHEQLSYIADHPKLADRYQGYLDNVMGNWSALTKNERVASQLMIFYPFLRMSLRWTFYAFPKEHPIRAATLAYLSQQNASRIKELMGGDPSYFTGWLKVPVNLGNGEHAYVPLSRIVPGGNALLEAAGGSIEGPKGTVALRTAQPTIGAAVTLATGVNPLTGKQEKGSFWSAMQQLFPTSLSAPGRALNEVLLPAGRKPGEGIGKTLPFLSNERQGALDKLSAKLTGYGTSERYVRNLGLPLLPESGSRVHDKERLGRTLKVLERNSTSAQDDLSKAYADRMKNVVEEGKQHLLPGLKKERDKKLAAMKKEYTEAQSALNGLFDKYKIPYKKEDALFLKFYGEGKYGSGGEEDNRFGLPATSGDKLREQFGLPSTSAEELKKQFGIK